jgi:AcrR family transcriptional regulator
MSGAVITYTRDMGRWEPDGQGRLEQAALELYLERGYDQTTVAEIAARAGLTERTFFRHFADKREVLFKGDLLAKAMTDAVDETPEATSPLDTIGIALESVSEFFADRREHARKRQIVIAANPALQERELIKLAGLGTALASALRDRGVAPATASLVAETGVAVFKVAFEHWLDDDTDRTLADHIRDSLSELRSATRP